MGNNNKNNNNNNPEGHVPFKNKPGPGPVPHPHVLSEGIDYQKASLDNKIVLYWTLIAVEVLLL
jgi:hypothetical protein